MSIDHIRLESISVDTSPEVAAKARRVVLAHNGADLLPVLGLGEAPETGVPDRD